MKYKVIGWTYYENYEILTSRKTIGFAERNAIIDEIRKHKYMFSGWDHQESWDGVVPILNDGKKRCFSQRGWGGVMAEAYGYMGDYDYASFTFHQSVSSKDKKSADDNFDILNYKPEIIENEHFEVTVNEGLFEIAKNKNPFYLEDLKELRYIDENDTITLHCNDESLNFVVKNIDRNKKNLNFKEHHLIEGNYKIIVTHKPESEKEEAKLPIIIVNSQARKIFKRCVKKYDFDTLLELFSNYDVGYLAKDDLKPEYINTFTRFIDEYLTKKYNVGIIINLLKYMDDFDLYKNISYKLIKTEDSLLLSFIDYYLENNINMDEHILNAVKLIKRNYYGMNKLIFRAIELKPDNKSLRKRYYSTIRHSNIEGFIVMAGLNLYDNLRKEDKELIELNDYQKYSSICIENIIELLTYPSKNAKACAKDLANYYENESPIIKEGILNYQKYINDKFNVKDILEPMMLHGISRKCYEMDQYLYGEMHAAKYIYKLDSLTNYNYDLKIKAYDNVKDKYPDFIDYLDDEYKS